MVRGPLEDARSGLQWVFLFLQKMVRDAYYFLIPVVGLAIVAAYAGMTTWMWMFLLLAGFVAFFFRNPEREIPADPDAVVSPADGKIIRLHSDEKGTTVSIFLSIFDVHVNRAPIGGVILKQEYRSGRFLAAFDERASVENERMTVTIGGSRELTFSLVAGLVARRIVAWKKEGDRLNKGDRIALIRFGSRTDIILPPDCEPVVKKGDRVRAGSSVIARWR